MPSSRQKNHAQDRYGASPFLFEKKRVTRGFQYYLLIWASTMLLFQMYIRLSQVWQGAQDFEPGSASTTLPFRRALDVIDEKLTFDHHARRASDFSLEIFSAPKPFLGPDREVNLRAIRSWQRLRPTPKITLLGYEVGYDDVAKDLGLRIRSDVDKTFLGVPLFNSMFHIANQSGATVTVIINGDIVLLQDFVVSVRRVLTNFANFLIVSARYDVESTSPHVKETSDSFNLEMKKHALQHGVLHTYGGMDLWAWNTNGPRLFDAKMPHFIFGRGKYDNWLTHETIAAGRRHVIDASEAIMSVHIRHGYNFVSQQRRSLLSTSNERFWSQGKKAKFELFINIYLSLRSGSYRNQMGSILFAPWRLARCLEPQGTCFVRRLRPGTCNCEYSSSSISTQTDPVVSENSRVIQCGVVSKERESDYTIPLVSGSDEQRPNAFGMPLTRTSLSEKLAINNTLIVTALNYGYRDFMMNWVCNLRHINVTNFIVAAFDHSLYEYGFVRGIPIYNEKIALEGHNTSLNDASYGSSSFKDLTKLKSRVVVQFLKSGYNVVWSDADIVWFRNPLVDLWSYEADMVIQTNAPDGENANALRRINSGFYLAKASSSVITAFEDVVQFASRSRMSEQPCFYDVICGKAGELKVGKNRCQYHKMSLLLLDRNVYPNGLTKRMWETDAHEILQKYPDVIILHNNWVKGSEAKLERFVKHDLVLYNGSNGLCNYPTWF